MKKSGYWGQLIAAKAKHASLVTWSDNRRFFAAVLRINNGKSSHHLKKIHGSPLLFLLMAVILFSIMMVRMHMGMNMDLVLMAMSMDMHKIVFL